MSGSATGGQCPATSRSNLWGLWRIRLMEHWKKAAVGALAVVGLAAGVTTPADARVSVAIGIGAPWGHPSACYDYWWDPVYVDGVWYQGPICWRWRHGVRVFFLHGR